MRIRNLLFIGALSFSTAANAQSWVEDSVEMGASYANDIFYSLQNGQVATANASDWHLAFQMTQFGNPWFNATVRANHIKGKVEVYSLHKTGNDFTSIGAADTNGLTLPYMQLINNDTSWGEGAFTQNRGTGVYDFGWGMYQGAPNHNLVGDSVYLVEVNNAAYKVWIQDYQSMGASQIGYTFRVANLDGTNDTTIVLKKNPDFANRLFAYYNLATQTVSDREPAKTSWDLLFTQYPKAGVFGPNGLQAFTGILTNDSVTVSEVVGIDPDTMTAASYTSYFSGMSHYINEIGDDWKTFNQSAMMYNIDTMKSWIVKSTNSMEYYQLKFTRFDGAFPPYTGKIVFATRLLGQVTNVKEIVSTIGAYTVAPNPANDNVTVMLDARSDAGNGKLIVTDIAGKVVMVKNMDIKSGINAVSFSTANLTSGTYMVTLTNGSWKATEKLSVQH